MTVMILEKTAFQNLFCLLNSAEAFRTYKPIKMSKNFAVSIFPGQFNYVKVNKPIDSLFSEGLTY